MTRRVVVDRRALPATTPPPLRAMYVQPVSGRVVPVQPRRAVRSASRSPQVAKAVLAAPARASRAAFAPGAGPAAPAAPEQALAPGANAADAGDRGDGAAAAPGAGDGADSGGSSSATPCGVVIITELATQYRPDGSHTATIRLDVTLRDGSVVGDELGWKFVYAHDSDDPFTAQGRAAQTPILLQPPPPGYDLGAQKTATAFAVEHTDRAGYTDLKDCPD